MHRRHPAPTIWLFTDARLGPNLLGIVRRLPLGSGLIYRHHELAAAERRALLRKLQRVATARRLRIIDDREDDVTRVHSVRELRRALLRKPELLFLSPLFATRSHPEWRPLGHMCAAAMVRLARRPVLALGGMDERRYRQVRKLGFVGWGGIDSFAPRRRARPPSSLA